MTDVDRISAKLAVMNAERAPARGATMVNGQQVAIRMYAGGGGQAAAGQSMASISGILKPHAQAKLLSPTEKCKVRLLLTFCCYKSRTA